MNPRNESVRSGGEQPTSAQPVYVAVPSSGPGMNIVEIWTALWRGKWLIIGSGFLFAILGIVYALSATPVYRAEVILAPVSRDQMGAFGELGGLASLAGINLPSGGNDMQPLAVLRSRHFIAEFIRDKSLLPVLFPDEWDEANNRWVSNSPEQQRDVRDGVKLFVDQVRTVSEDPQTGLVTLAIEWRDPGVAAAWASELVQRLNEKLRQKDIDESQRKLDYLREQLNQANLVELRQAISRVIEEQISAMMLAQAQLEYAFTVIDPAVEPKQRSWPKRTMIVILAGLLGGFVGTFLVLIGFAVRKQVSAQQQ